MKWFVFLCLAVSFSICSAQELGLDGDTAVSKLSLEDELKQSGMDDLLVDEIIPVAKSVKTDTVKAVIGAVDTSRTILVQDSNSTIANSEPTVVTPVESVVVENKTVIPTDTIVEAAKTEVDVISTATVSSVSSVDIQGSLEGYRSPLRAMFFSLALPGAGQAYTKKYVKAGAFVAVEIAAIVGAVKFKNAGEAIRKDAHDMVDKNFTIARLEDFYSNATKYALSKGNKVTKDSVEAYLFGGTKSNDSVSAIKQYIQGVTSDLYSNAKGYDVVQGWSDATPKYNPDASGATTPFYREAGIVVDSIFGIKIAGKTPYGTSALQEQYKGLLDSSEKRFNWSQNMVVAIIVNHIASATDAFIGAHRYNRSIMNEKIEKGPSISLENDLYRNQFGYLTTSLDLVWKF